MKKNKQLIILISIIAIGLLAFIAAQQTGLIKNPVKSKVDFKYTPSLSRGTITAINQSNIIIKQGNKTESFTLGDDVKILKATPPQDGNSQPVVNELSASDLKEGQEVILTVNKEYSKVVSIQIF